MTKCVRSMLVDYYRDYEIYREVDKHVDPSTFETYGHERVFYVVYSGGWMLESFKTIKDARRYIDKLC